MKYLCSRCIYRWTF